jgi:hypothetical protein
MAADAPSLDRPRPRVRDWQRRGLFRRRWRLARNFVLVIAGLVAFVLLTSEEGGIREFSPHTLEFRSRTERTIYATGIPLYRSPYKVWTGPDNPVLEHLIEQGIVTPVKKEPNQWLKVMHWNEGWRGDGGGELNSVLFRQQHATLEWMQQHPECARLCFEEGFRLLRSDAIHDQVAGERIIFKGRFIEDLDDMRNRISQISARHRAWRSRW